MGVGEGVGERVGEWEDKVNGEDFILEILWV